MREGSNINTEQSILFQKEISKVPLRSLSSAALLLCCLLTLVFTAPAVAAPSLGVTLTHDPVTMPRNDEQLTYLAKVRNTASSNPVPGDSLGCDPNGTKWFNVASPATDFTFKWLRDGNYSSPVAETSGGSTSTYVVVPADAGHSIACVVSSANAGAAAAYATTPVVVDPVPASAPPRYSGPVTGNPRPLVSNANGGLGAAGVRFCSPGPTWSGPSLATANSTSGSNELTSVSGGFPFAVGQEVVVPGAPAGSTITAVGAGTLTLSAAIGAGSGAEGVAVSAISSGTVTTTTGSNVITSLISAAGTGTTTSGSTAVTALNMTSGRWVVGLPVTGPGIPAGTTVAATSGTGLTLSQPATASAAGVFIFSEGPLPFAQGQEISGPGIPVGTTVTAVGSGSLTLSNPATASATAVGVTATAAGKWSFQWLRNAQPITGATSASHPLSITGTATTTAGSNQLTLVATARGTGVLSSGSTAVTNVATLTGSFLPGQEVTGIGIPDGTTVVSIGSESLELSAAATASGSQELTAGAQPFAAGQKINGAGIPAGTTVTAVSGRTVTISANATASAVGVAVAAGPDIATQLQCAVIGMTGGGGPPSGGSAIAISNTSLVPTVTPAGPNNNKSNQTEMPQLAFGNSTTGPVTLEFNLPPGEDVSLYSFAAPSWVCNGLPLGDQPTKVVCERQGELKPGEESSVTVRLVVGPSSPDSLIAKAEAFGGGAAVPGVAEDTFEFGPPTPFEISSFVTKASDALGNDYTQAGGHPTSVSARFTIPTRHLPSGLPTGVENVRNIITDAPPGFVGNPEAVPEVCASMAAVVEDEFADPACPRPSIVGSVDLESQVTGITPHEYDGLALYSIKPDRGSPAQFGFVVKVLGFYTPIALKPRLRPEEGYAVSIEAPQVGKTVVPKLVSVNLCSYGVEILGAGPLWEGAPKVSGCLKADDPGANPIPFLTNPTSCVAASSVTKISIDSWEHPGEFKSTEASTPPLTGCDDVPFSPVVSMQPTSHQAESPTGLDVSIAVPSEGLESPIGVSQAHLKKAVVTLPKGMAVNPAAANGLDACTQAQLGMSDGVPDDDPVQCPAASKVGSAEVITPILSAPLTGSVFIAKQGDNPFKSLLSLYLVAESEERGIRIKLPGRVAVDPDTGQLVTTFDNNPQAPISSIRLHFNSGNRAPLLNPPSCGSYDIVSEFVPWSVADPNSPTSAEIATRVSTFQVTSGPGGGPCPSGGLSPRLEAGVVNPIAGSTSPFVVSLTRKEGTQRFSGLDLTLPPGLAAYLKGIPYCPDVALASVPSGEGTGAAELAIPSCPAASQIGSVSVGVGGGSSPFYVNTAKAYLAGPYKGAPLSIAVVAPAVAGPFDLGSVVIRSGAYVNSKTAQITVKSDPIPTILHGIPLNVSDVRIAIDRPSFIVAPTNCEPMSVSARVRGEKGDTADASNRFQVGDCGNLGFKPNLKIQLKGGTRRDKYQQLTATLTARPGDANIAGASVRFPQSIFLAQEHIGTVCTRVQFAADSCPPRSVYGYAEAVTPLLDQPLVGPVYLRSSDNVLPDLVAALRGPDSQPIEVELVGRTDSKNRGLRNTFDVVPDAPVSKFTLRMLGGKKSLLVTSRNICLRKERAVVKMRGQNGMTRDFRPVIQAACKKQKKALRAKKRR